jgi:hypothetical protein
MSLKKSLMYYISILYQYNRSTSLSQGTLLSFWGCINNQGSAIQCCSVIGGGSFSRMCNLFSNSFLYVGVMEGTVSSLFKTLIVAISKDD